VARASRTTTSRIAVALVAAATLAGCGGEDEPVRSSTAAKPDKPVDINPVGLERAGSYAQQADCAAWKAGTPEQRMRTIRDIRGQTTLQNDPDPRSPLPDEVAYEVYQHACKPERADSLSLYRLYFRDQGFAPLRDADKG